MSDHGMTTDGNHGGGSAEETDSVLFMYSKAGVRSHHEWVSSGSEAWCGIRPGSDAPAARWFVEEQKKQEAGLSGARKEEAAANDHRADPEWAELSLLPISDWLVDPCGQRVMAVVCRVICFEPPAGSIRRGGYLMMFRSWRNCLRPCALSRRRRLWAGHGVAGRYRANACAASGSANTLRQSGGGDTATAFMGTTAAGVCGVERCGRTR